MRRRLRATCEQPAKARSGGVVRIVMQRISIADHARKSAGIPRIKRKERGKPLVRMGRDHFYFPKSGTDLRCAFWYFLRHRLGGGVPVHLLGLVGRWPPAQLITAGICEQRNGQTADVRFGSIADIGRLPIDVRFTPKSGHWNSVVECPLCAKSGLMHRSKERPI